MESSPRLARLLADSLDVPVGSLRAMAEQGELTADKLLRALTDTKFTASIDAEFKQMPVTFDQAMTQVHNAAIVTFGAFDQGGEFSTMLANFVSGGADGFKGLERSAEDLGINIRSAFSGLSDAFEPMLEGALSVFGQVNDEALTLRDSIASLLGAVDDVRNIPRTLALKAGERFKEETGLTLPQSWLVGDSQASNMRGRFVSGFDASRRRLTGTAGQRRFDAFAGGYDAPRAIAAPTAVGVRHDGRFRSSEGFLQLPAPQHACSAARLFPQHARKTPCPHPCSSRSPSPPRWCWPPRRRRRCKPRSRPLRPHPSTTSANSILPSPPARTSTHTPTANGSRPTRSPRNASAGARSTSCASRACMRSAASSKRRKIGRAH